MIVHSDDGLDEISLAAETTIAELKNGHISEYKFKPEDVDITSQSLMGLTVDSAEQSYQLIKDALGKRETDAGNKAADIIALNAGAAIYAANIANSLEQGVEMAQDAIYSGLALGKLNDLVTFTRYLEEDQA